MKTHPTPFLLGSFLIILIILTFSTSCILAASGVPSLITGDGSSSTAAAIMDAGRKTLSSWLYGKADLYFHKGKPRQVDLAFSDSVFQKLCAKLSPAEHVHSTGNEVREILPWLWLAVQADPQNIDNYLVSSFWLANEAGRPDLARNVLARARWNNPFSYRVAMEDAIISLQQGNTEAASSLLDAGLAFWNRNADSKDRADRLNLGRMLLYRALLFEAEGEKEEAIAMLTEILRLFPERKHIETRIAELRSGDQPSLLASSIWSDILHADIKKRKEQEACEYDEPPGSKHEHHEQNE